MNKAGHLLPQKIYVELTTRCNLHCQMCVKQMAGSCIPEADMDLAVFRQLVPSLTHTNTLILNGIGESLLHPDLAEIINFARERMSENGMIGIQSNGLLINQSTASQLVKAGLSSLCLSVDRFDSVSDRGYYGGGHSFFAVAEAVSNLRRARKNFAGRFKIGMETVLSKESVHDLPALVAWAADNGVGYIIVTHLILYDKATETANLFNPNSQEAVQLFNKYNHAAASKGISLGDAIDVYRKYVGTRTDGEVLQLISELKGEARDKDIRLNLDSLIDHDANPTEEVTYLLNKAQSLANSRGVELFLPPMQAPSERNCPFLEEKATFVAVNGDVMPCHFLWHTYSCRVLNEDIHVQKRVVGNISEQPLDQIWLGKEYNDFRKEAKKYDYSSCWSCSQGPCAKLVSDDDHYANDCYGSMIPCGHCQWNLGGIRCL
jgi:putative metalloenzyme radical SAM/SPASM domain maturase